MYPFFSTRKTWGHAHHIAAFLYAMIQGGRVAMAPRGYLRTRAAELWTCEHISELCYTRIMTLRYTLAYLLKAPCPLQAI